MSAREIKDGPDCVLRGSVTKGFLNAPAGRKANRKIVKSITLYIHRIRTVYLQGDFV